MPLVRIDLPGGRSAGYAATVGTAVAQAPHATMGVPEDWSFGNGEAQRILEGDGR